MNRLPLERCRYCDRYCDGCPMSRKADPLDAARGVVNGAVAGVILWALLAVFMFYAFRISL